MIHEKICAFFIACFLRFTFFASSIQALRSAEGHIDLTESDIASDKGEALIDEFVKLCEEYELSTFNVEKIISMFPDVSVDDFIYSERGYIGRSTSMRNLTQNH